MDTSYHHITLALSAGPTEGLRAETVRLNSQPLSPRVIRYRCPERPTASTAQEASAVAAYIAARFRLTLPAHD